MELDEIALEILQGLLASHTGNLTEPVMRTVVEQAFQIARLFDAESVRQAAFARMGVTNGEDPE